MLVAALTLGCGGARAGGEPSPAAPGEPARAEEPLEAELGLLGLYGFPVIASSTPIHPAYARGRTELRAAGQALDDGERWGAAAQAYLRAAAAFREVPASDEHAESFEELRRLSCANAFVSFVNAGDEAGARAAARDLDDGDPRCAGILRGESPLDPRASRTEAHP